MKEFYVTGFWRNVFLYACGFTHLRVETTPKGTRFYYEDSESLQEAVEQSKTDEWLAGIMDAHAKTKTAINEAQRNGNK